MSEFHESATEILADELFLDREVTRANLLATTRVAEMSCLVRNGGQDLDLLVSCILFSLFQGGSISLRVHIKDGR